MSADSSEKKKSKLPSWLSDDSDLSKDAAVPSWLEAEKEEAPAAAPAAEEKVSAENTEEAEPEPEKKISEEKPSEVKNNDDMLLGAPVSGSDSDADEFLASAKPSEEKKSEELKEVSMLSGAEVPPMFLESKKEEAKAAVPEVSAEEKEAEAKKNAELEKTRAELEQLEEIVSRLEFLSYLKPRISRIKTSGCDPHDLIGLYRMSSKVMLEQLIKQAEAMRKYKNEYDKRMRKFQEDVLFEQSSALVNGLSKSGKIDRAELKAKAAQAQSAPESEPAAASSEDLRTAVTSELSSQMESWRRQMEIKDNILLKAKQEAEEAQKRCDKMAQDVANVRARLEKDLKLKSQKAKEALFNRILPVLDSFDGALRSEQSAQSVESVFDGLKNIHRQLFDSCTAEGLEVIKTEKAEFDPNFHEAMGSVPTSEIPEDHIYDELRRGYLLDGKLLRAAMVRLAAREDK